MRGSRLLLVAGSTLVLAATSAVTVASAAPSYEVRYRGEVGSNGRVVDKSGHGRGGVVHGVNGGSVASMSENGDPYLRFPAGSCAVSPCTQALIQVNNAAEALSPKAERFAFGADVRLTGEAAHDAGMNVFQYGLGAVGASQWKLQIDYGVASCRWADGTHVVKLPTRADEQSFRLQPGGWYSIRCERRPDNEFVVTLHERGSAVPVADAFTTSPQFGEISLKKADSATIGAKSVNEAKSDAQTDQFRGDLDELYFHRF